MELGNRSRRWGAIVGAGVLAVAIGAAPASVAAVAPDPASPAEAEVVSVRVTPSGMVVQTVRLGDSTVTTYGPEAPPVSIAQHGRSATASISVTPSQPGERRSDRTVFEMTLASGHFTRAEACAFAKAIDPRGCVTSAMVRSRPPSARSTSARSQFLDTRCWTFTHEPGDGTKYNYNCNYRRIDFQNKNLWLISNRMQATGWEENGGTCCDYLQGVGVRAEYDDSDAHAVKWSPGETRSIADSCRSMTTSVTSSRTGSTYSVSNEVCPDKLAPWHSPAFQYFGAKWTGPGAPHEDRRGAIATSLVRVDKPGTRTYDLAAWLKWG